MPFGLSGAAPNFQKAIDIILKPVIGRFVSVYMDDVIITSPSFNEHLDHLNQVFTLLRDAGLTLNKDKCHFARDKLKYLGLVISKEGIETDNSKVKAITEMKPPKNSKEVSKVLGMAGWYQKFIPKYADICEPLYRLKKKGAKFNWSTEAQDSFDKIKRALTMAPVLQLPNFTEQFNLFTDASGVGIGAVLNQNHRPIAFTSRTLNKAELNYTVTESECLAVIWALNKFKTYFGSLPVKANLMERVNRTLVQMIACFVEENPDNWDRFLHEFSFALRTSVNERTGKTPAELFLSRKIVTPFRKLINVTEGAEYVGGNIEKSFDDARKNMRKKHKTWENYYNRKWREVNIKVNDFGFGTNSFYYCCE
ncbi:retrovirus-related Pol polyprotein from transposon 297 [Trichonephila clavipes]|nr:retrovirus-related Pol polyprotein from transposon 297 [Trichonephila clavipes]